jgi:5-methylcytosine-specific restriction endonuclease McrBC regulatory subunit McrC
MLHNLSDRVTECIARAADTERRASEVTDSQLREDLIDTARRWRHLADSYQFVESLDRFIVGQKSHHQSKSA